MTKPEQIPLCTPDEIRPVASAQMPDLDCWLVVAFWISGRRRRRLVEGVHRALAVARVELARRTLGGVVTHIQRHLMRVVIRPGGGA